MVCYEYYCCDFYKAAFVRHFDCSISPTPFFNFTVDVHFSLENMNDVTFAYDNSSVNMLYGNSNISNGVLGNGTLKGYESKRIDITFNLMPNNNDIFFMGGTHNLINDIVSDSLNLATYPQLNDFFGFKKFKMDFQKRRTSAERACNFRLIFTLHSIYNLQCPI